jgi:hypothetical protein
MRPRTLVVMVIAAAAIVAVLLALRGDGHRMLTEWLPKLHGSR